MSRIDSGKVSLNKEWIAPRDSDPRVEYDFAADDGERYYFTYDPRIPPGGQGLKFLTDPQKTKQMLM